MFPSASTRSFFSFHLKEFLLRLKTGTDIGEVARERSFLDPVDALLWSDDEVGERVSVLFKAM